MAHEGYTNIGKLTWDKDPSAVTEARNVYERSGSNPATLLMFASTLYSFRKDPKIAHELMLLRTRFMDRMNKLIIVQPTADRKKFAEQADTASTILTWMATNLSQDFEPTLQVAESYARSGEAATKEEPLGGHTRALLSIIIALQFKLRQEFAGRLIRYDLFWLDEAGRRAPWITDLNQRQRVFRNLAYHNYQAGRKGTALRFFIAWFLLRLKRKVFP